MNPAEQTALQSHEHLSCDDLCRVHYSRVLQLCRLLLTERRDAEEVAQEVFLKLVHEYRKDIEIRSWEAWLVRVTVNACHDRRRSAWWKWWRTQDDAFYEDDLPSQAPTPEEHFLNREEREHVWQALHKLSARQREVFVLRRLEGWSTEVVAEMLGVTAGSVKRHLFHALRHLNKALGGRT